MKNIDERRFWRRGFVWVLLAALAAGVFFVWYLQKEQVYTAQATLQCNTAAEGEPAPDLSQIFSEKNIRSAFEEFGLALDVEAVRSGGSITENALGQYTVNLSLEAKDASREQTRFALDALLDRYFALYCTQDTAALAALDDVPASTSGLCDSSYDYIEQAEQLGDFIDQIILPLEACQDAAPAFVSAQTGYSVSALLDEYRAMRDGRLAYIYADILRNQLSKNADVLLKKYRERCEMPGTRTAAQTALDRQVLAAFEQEPTAELDTAAAKARVQNELNSLQNKLQVMHPLLTSTLEEYVAYCGAAALRTVSSVTVNQRADVALYTLLGTAGVFLCGCCILFCAGRVYALWRAGEGKH